MASTTKTLITFVFSVIFIISYVHCHTTIASTAPDKNEPEPKGQEPAKFGYCFETPACYAPGQYAIGCIVYCKEAHYAFAQCNGKKCCCYHKNMNASEVK
ncbi:hypothetical protein CARUB_v10021676mg [Capsella rubella]|uniref:Knottin scorpion toxin-like domain-containing protein n=1 Tax=Capsella rubella TaxID=81985 RepID=R0HWF5_9BRAS|nr:hypothetical protein CARUB_v10021676mg [Capsella rubella]